MTTTKRKDVGALLARAGGQSGVARLHPSSFATPGGPAEGDGATAPAAFVRLIYPPWIEKLPTSRDFNRNLFTAVLLAGAGTTVIPVTFSLPPTMIGYVQIFGLYVLTPTALTDITFTLRVNEGPVEGYDNQRLPPGVANFLEQNFSDIRVPVPNGGKIDVLVTNNSAAGPWTVGAKIAGYFHSTLEERRVYGAL